VLSEEALIVLGALGACGLLVLGALELLWPSRPRPPARRPPPAPVQTLRVHRTSALTRHALEPGRSGYARRASATIEPSPALVEPTVPDAPAAGEFAAAWQLGESIVEDCFTLHRGGRHAEVIELAAAALAGAPGARRPADAQETAALWSLVALARQALGEDDEARAALEAAIEAAPPAERATYQRQLATLADRVARDLLAEAERHPRPESEECLTAIRRAIAWIECGTAAMAADPALAELAAGAHAMLWPAWERTVMALVQRQDFRAARRLLREALADPGFPPGRAETFRGLFSGTFSGEIGQLTAQAIRSVQDAREADALSALERAESLLGTLSDEALPPKRREEVDRRLWWGYRTLGERRVEAGDFEAALEPLFHALGYDVGPERREETRALLLRGLDGVADARALAVRERADAGDREAAVVQCDKLWVLLRGANDRGLTLTELTGVYVKVQRLFESLGRS
jgi:tetratricopeptide (TPR) repeat protein